jgi:hypothetical protein
MPGPRIEIDFSQLVDWVEGRLSEEEARVVDEKVAVADSATLADIAWLQKLIRATEDTALESPPAEVRNTLVTRFEAYAEGRRTPGLLKRIGATLAFDGGLRPAAGVRTASTQGARRQLIYTSDTLDIALNFWPRASDNYLEVEGQVFPREDTELDSFIVQLLRAETEVAIAATDDMGSFNFESIQPAVYTVIACTDRVEVSNTRVELYP